MPNVKEMETKKNTILFDVVSEACGTSIISIDKCVVYELCLFYQGAPLPLTMPFPLTLPPSPSTFFDALFSLDLLLALINSIHAIDFKPCVFLSIFFYFLFLNRPRVHHLLRIDACSQQQQQHTEITMFCLRVYTQYKTIGMQLECKISKAYLLFPVFEQSTHECIHEKSEIGKHSTYKNQFFVSFVVCR